MPWVPPIGWEAPGSSRASRAGADGRSALQRKRVSSCSSRSEAVVATADVVLSVVPPAAAREVAKAVAAATARTGRPRSSPTSTPSRPRPWPSSRRSAGRRARPRRRIDLRARPGPGGSTTLYLAGLRAAELAGLRAPGLDTANRGAGAGPRLRREDVHGLGLQGTRRALRPCGADGPCERRARGGARRSRSSYPDWSSARTWPSPVLSPKAGRYVGEMREIEATQAAAGLPPALFAAMADVYAELASRGDGRPPEDASAEVPLETVLDSLAR